MSRGIESRRGGARRFVLVAMVLLMAVAGASAYAWYGRGEQADVLAQLDDLPTELPELDATSVQRVERFCGDCHGLPRPENYPRSVWYSMARRAYSYYVGSGRTDLDPPAPRLTEVYYMSRAAERPPFVVPEEAPQPFDVQFVVEKIDCSPHLDLPPEVSSLRWAKLQPGDTDVLLVADMREGGIFSLRPGAGTQSVRQLARLNNPCHIEPCDLDADGDTDLVVADLGSIHAYDHDRGRVVLLQRRDDGSYRQVVLLDNIGRIADVRPFDADADGDLDLVVAEFGTRRSGNILLLRNTTPEDGPLRMEVEQLDRRPGTTHVPVVDLNGDDHPDFVAVVTQEYECVDLFLNRGDGVFRRQPLWAGPDASFGSNGIELVDLDDDGDLDILHTNGDMFDDEYLKPCHGVRWLENLGNLQFTAHELTRLPGTCVARSGDLDQDGDLDILVSAWVSPAPKPNWVNPADLTSIICLEQTSPGQFAYHTLEKGVPFHAAMELADFDADGDLDFAVGVIAPYRAAGVEIWWNRGRGSSQ